MITFGQAACLVLGDPPTDENRKKAKEYLANSRFTVTYRLGEDPFSPFAIGRELVEINPFKYLSYPETPPSSPTLSPVLFDAKNTNFDSEVSPASVSASALPKQENPQSDENSDSSDEELTGVPHGGRHMLDLLAQMAFLEEPENQKMYDRKFMAERDVFQLLQQYFPKIEEIFSEDRVNEMVSLDERWGQVKRFQSETGGVKGRWLWVIKSRYRDFKETANNKAYIKHIKAVRKTWVTVGYTRRAPSAEDYQTRQRLLQLTITRLLLNGRCQRVYASPICAAASRILERDYPRVSTILNELKDCKGDLTDLTFYLQTCAHSVRLVVIGHAGLSTDMADIKTFVKFYKRIKEIVVDHGNKMEVITRDEILHNDEAIHRFRGHEQHVGRSSSQ